jgi:RNA polymerase sigma-70 factor (ECF subfamily)
MASFGQSQSRPRDPLHSASARLYKFALVLTANEELARALLRGALKAMNARKEIADEDRDHFMGAFRRMHLLWTAKLSEDPDIEKKCPPDARLFTSALAKGTLAGNAHFAKFIANMPSLQRAGLYLVYGEGASYDEAAEVTGQQMLSFMKLLARGHVALSHWLDHRGLSEGERSPERERAA